MLVRNRMTHNPVTVASQDTLATAQEKMTTGVFRHLPVVQDGTLVGGLSVLENSNLVVIIATSDMLRAFLAVLDASAEGTVRIDVLQEERRTNSVPCGRFHSCQYIASFLQSCASHREAQVLYLTDPYCFPDLNRFLTLRGPDLAVYLYFTYRCNAGDDPPDLVDQSFFACDRLLALRREHQIAYHQHKTAHSRYRRKDDSAIDDEPFTRPVKEHERAQHKRDNATDAKETKAGDKHLGDEKGYSEQDEGCPSVIDW
jgi:CBS domain-containing protein